MAKLKIAPSILSADFGQLNAEVATVAAADFLHCDVMDGHFVPNLTFGAPVLKKVKTNLVRDYHLMVSQPEKLIEDFVAAGADYITIHRESSNNVKKNLQKVKKNCKVGLALKPKTQVGLLKPFLNLVDLVLVMTVEPGFGGQDFLPACLPKVTQLKELNPDLLVAVDGGINLQTAPLCRQAGADILVAGSAIFRVPVNKRQQLITKLRGS